MSRSLDESMRLLANEVLPREALELQQSVVQAIDAQGKLTPEARRGVQTPVALQWEPGSTQRQRAPRAGVAVTLAAHCATPPSSGNAVVTMTQVSTAGTGPGAVLTIPDGAAIAETALAIDVRAGAWVGATVTTANGASGVSISLVIEVR